MKTAFTVVGLLLDICGALVMARGLVTMTDKEAIATGVARWASKDEEKNKQQPLVQSFIRGSRDAKVGAILLAVGFLLQIVGAVLG